MSDRLRNATLYISNVHYTSLLFVSGQLRSGRLGVVFNAMAKVHLLHPMHNTKSYCNLKYTSVFNPSISTTTKLSTYVFKLDKYNMTITNYKGFIAAVVLFISPAVAQSSTTVFVPELVGSLSGLGASVIAARPTATTYAVECQTARPDDCGISSPITIVAGPSTVEQFINEDDFVAWTKCKCASSVPTLCTYSQSSGVLSILTTEKITNPEFATLGPLRVTAGLEKLGPGNVPAPTPGGNGSFLRRSWWLEHMCL